MLVRQRNQESVYNSVHYRHSWALLHGFRSNFLLVAYVSLQRRYLNSSTTNMYTNILNNKCQKYLKSMSSVSILIAVLFFFSGSLLVRIVVDLIQALPKEVLNLTFALANINSFFNPFNYFINIAEFKIVLKRVCSITQWSD